MNLQILILKDIGICSDDMGWENGQSWRDKWLRGEFNKSGKREKINKTLDEYENEKTNKEADKET